MVHYFKKLSEYALLLHCSFSLWHIWFSCVLGSMTQMVNFIPECKFEATLNLATPLIQDYLPSSFMALESIWSLRCIFPKIWMTFYSLNWKYQFTFQDIPLQRENKACKWRPYKVVTMCNFKSQRHTAALASELHTTAQKRSFFKRGWGI